MIPEAPFPRRWGPYVLIWPLGSGGMGSVYLALTRRAGEETLCVVKRLTSETLSDPARRERFKREGEISQNLSNAGIARTIEAAAVDGEPCLAQEYVEGRTVSQLVSAASGIPETLSPFIVAHIGQRVASALAYAHRLNVVHRDIAPSNVMVGFDGGVRLIDFGIARRVTDAALTATGDFIGRAAYSAPEVLAGGDADARSDIYALGVLLWELLVGRPPAFEELKARPVPSSLAPNAGISGELDRLVMRALDAEPAGRFQGAEDFASALQQAVPASLDGSKELTGLIGRCYDIPAERRRLAEAREEARGLLGTVGSSPRRRPVWPLVLGGFGVVGAALAAVLVLRSTSDPPSTPGSPPVASTPISPAAPKPPNQPLPVVPAEGAPSAAAPTSKPAISRPSDKRFPTAARTITPTKRAVGSPLSGQAGALLDSARDSLGDGAYEQAARSAKEVLDVGSDPQKSAAHFILGKVLMFEGQRKEAASEFSLAIQLDPGNSAATDQLATLRRRGVE